MRNQVGNLPFFGIKYIKLDFDVFLTRLIIGDV